MSVPPKMISTSPSSRRPASPARVAHAAARASCPRHRMRAIRGHSCDLQIWAKSPLLRSSNTKVRGRGTGEWSVLRPRVRRGAAGWERGEEGDAHPHPRLARGAGRRIGLCRRSPPPSCCPSPLPCPIPSSPPAGARGPADAHPLALSAPRSTGGGDRHICARSSAPEGPRERGERESVSMSSRS
jgi:hypothetical protein